MTFPAAIVSPNREFLAYELGETGSLEAETLVIQSLDGDVVAVCHGKKIGAESANGRTINKFGLKKMKTNFRAISF
jgi:hypothetical protein